MNFPRCSGARRRPRAPPWHLRGRRCRRRARTRRSRALLSFFFPNVLRRSARRSARSWIAASKPHPLLERRGTYTSLRTFASGGSARRSHFEMSRRRRAAVSSRRGRRKSHRRRVRSRAAGRAASERRRDARVAACLPPERFTLSLKAQGLRMTVQSDAPLPLNARSVRAHRARRQRRLASTRPAAAAGTMSGGARAQAVDARRPLTCGVVLARR